MAQSSRQLPPYLETGSARLARERRTRLPTLPPLIVQLVVIGPVSPPSAIAYTRACLRAHRWPARAEIHQLRQLPGGVR
jgi:hypothetical protein